MRQERILRQRHSIRAIPVHEVAYLYKDQTKRLWVYGLDHQVCRGGTAHSAGLTDAPGRFLFLQTQVYCPDYPATICWGACVLQ